jgi:hypothetical protein
MVRKLQAGFMPPPLAARPDPATYSALIRALEHSVDAAGSATSNPGVRTFQRLNRPEYARAVRDLLALDVDAGSWLPLDTKSANFDNIADAQPAGGRRSACASGRFGLHQRGVCVAAPMEPRRGRAVRHPRRHGRRPRLPG